MQYAGIIFRCDEIAFRGGIFIMIFGMQEDGLMKRLAWRGQRLLPFVAAAAILLTGLTGLTGNSIRFQSAAAAADGFSMQITKEQDTAFLDADFAAYNLGWTTSAAAAGGPYKPSAIDPKSYNGKYSYWTAKGYGGNSRGFLKPTAVLSDCFSALTYTTESFYNFEASYEFLAGWSIFGLAFGAAKGSFPLTKNNDASDDTGVLIYMENDGSLSVGGAIDTSSAQVPDGVTCTVGGQKNLNGVSNLYFKGMTEGEQIAVEANPAADTNQTFTVCVRVQDGLLTLWESDHPDKAVSLRLTSGYQGGYASLVSNQTQHGAFRALSLRSLTSTEQTVSADFTQMTPAALNKKPLTPIGSPALPSRRSRARPKPIGPNRPGLTATKGIIGTIG